MTEYVAHLSTGIVSDVIYLFYVLCIVGFLWIFEALAPAETGHTLQGRIHNIRFISVFLLIGGLLLNSAIFLLAPVLTDIAPAIENRPFIHSFGLILLHIFAGDFIFYWYHRAQHHFPKFWLIHELHHSDTSLNATTSLRTYALERPLQFLVINVPVIILVASVPTLSPFALSGNEIIAAYGLSSLWLFFTHANIRLELGLLSWLMTAPQTHRIHHSLLTYHQDTNFAQFFPILDVLFGTYHHPEPGEFPKTGTQSLPSDVTVNAALARPFRIWTKS